MNKQKIQILIKRYKIEKYVPIPELPKRPSFYKDLLSRMKSGDSILLESYIKKNGLCAMCRKWKIKYATRKEGSKFRFWRL